MASTKSTPSKEPVVPKEEVVAPVAVAVAEPVAVAVVAAANEGAVVPAEPVAAPIVPIQAAPVNMGDSDDEGIDEPEENADPNAPKRELTEDEKYVREVRKKWRTMTDTELRETMAKPLGAAELVRESSRMNEDQLQIIAPFFTEAQIASTMPSLQLQHQGALVQGFTTPQVRLAVRAIPQGDRQLLLQNITLITASETDPSKDDEIQGIIGFIDPLAMAVAVERPELVDKVIQATSIMTPEQIRVMVPLLTVPQLRTTIETIVSSEGHAIAIMMLMPEQRTELVGQCATELVELEAGVKKLNGDVLSLSETRLPELSRLVHAFCNKPLTSLAAREHQGLAMKLTSAKTALEKCHREVRQLQGKMKLATVLLNDGETEGALKKSYAAVQDDLGRLGKTVSAQYAILDNSGDSSTGLIHKLYDTWTRFQAESKGDSSAKPEEIALTASQGLEDSIYTDSDLSTALFVAVQSIGNPNTIGDIFQFSWNDIIDQGFRSADDFSSKGISSLKQLETYINSAKTKTCKDSSTSSTQATASQPLLPE